MSRNWVTAYDELHTLVTHILKVGARADLYTGRKLRSV